MMVEFTEDRTFYLEPHPTPSGTGTTYNKNSCTGLLINLSNPGSGIFKTKVLGPQLVPFFGAFDAAATQQQGGYQGSEPPGWQRWMGFAQSNSAPYRQCTVVGAKYEFRAEQLHNAFLQPGQGSKSMAITHWIDKRPDSVSQVNTLSEIQNIRNVRQHNLVCITDQVDQTHQVIPNAQQCFGSGTYSAKKFWGLNDIKDNQDKLGGRYHSTVGFNGPDDQAYLHIALNDRIETEDPQGYVMPSILIRVKVKLMCLLSEANGTSNWTSATTGADAGGGE